MVAEQGGTTLSANRPAGADDWETFTALQTCRPILGGLGNIDDFRPEGGALGDYQGASVRVFDPATGLWSIHWLDNVRCALFPPTVGRFDGAVGTFFGDDEHDGRPVRVRFTWSEITPTSARWEQSFSADDGATWESNWVMTFARLAVTPS
jgi:hypothetical protein